MNLIIAVATQAKLGTLSTVTLSVFATGLSMQYNGCLQKVEYFCTVAAKSLSQLHEAKVELF